MDMKKDTDSKTQSRKRLPEIYWYAGLGMLFLLSIYLRAVVPFRNVFIGDAVRFSSESDAWYHMMLAKTTFLHWQRPWFDPLTNFPNGTPLHFGPFLSWGVALLSKIVGLGGSDLHTVDVVGAFWPVIMGSLLILPVYHIGKELGGRGCGITAAALTVVLPGQLFSRTVLGFTDHHSSEILLSTLSMLLFILAFRSGRSLSFSMLRDINAVKRPLVLTVLAGIALGLYVDAWSMGILFEGILLIAITLQSVVEHYRGRSGEYLGITGAIGLFFAFLMVVPFAHSYNRFSIIQYSLFQPSMLLLGSIFCLELAVASREVSRRGLSWALYPGSVAGVVLLDLLIVVLAVPELFSAVVYGLKTYMLPRTGGAATVAELSPIYMDLGRGVTGIDENFPGLIRILSPFYIAIIGLCMLVYRYLRDSRAPYLLVIVWSAVTLIITLAANRSAYYYAVNVALLCGYLASQAYARAGLSDIEDVLARSPSNLTREVRPERLASAAAVILIVIILAYPSVLSSHAIARYSVGPNQDWVSSIEWLRSNTPYPGLDIYDVYERPPEGQYFQYPETAYGVMSWWDYGHLIETIGHRYPNANPFQEGIGSKTAGTPGSSPFFLAESEGEAEDVLTRLNESRPPYMNARYIMTDVEMAVTKFHAIAAWSSIPLTRYTGAVYQPQADSLVPIQVWMPEYFRTMVARLHFFDGSEVEPQDPVAIAYTRVTMPDGTPLTVITKSPLIPKSEKELESFINESLSEGYNVSVVSRSFARSPVHVEALQHYRLVHESTTQVTTEGNRYVKTFEHVPGAVIKGRASPGSKVVIEVPIMTNQKRLFIYRQSNVTDSNGEFVLVVPYSTEGPVVWGTNFDTRPIGAYRLTVNGASREVRVSEKDVLSGGVVEV